MPNTVKLDAQRQSQYKRKVEERFSQELLITDPCSMITVLEKELSNKISKSEADAVIAKLRKHLEGASLNLKKIMSLRYGENPGQPAAFYSEEGAMGPLMATMEVLREGAKGLSYINIGDMDLGQRLVKKLHDAFPGKHVCAVMKHEMPSSVAIGEEPVQTFEKAWKCDELSNFGSVDVFNYEVTEELAKLLCEGRRNIEVVYAPSFAAKALDILSARKALRVVKMADINKPAVYEDTEYKRVAGGLLVQNKYDTRVISRDCVEIISKRKLGNDEIDAAIFTWIVAGFTRSNAVIIGQKDKTHGIGSGQRSRIDSANNAIVASQRGYGPKDCVLASDAYMPFADVVELAARNNIKAIIYPLGSNKDEEVLAKADELGIAMIVTRKPGTSDSERCFLHR
ncbi:hypothetical protein ACFL6Y_02025 [Elusimicrobiota bacterium]